MNRVRNRGEGFVVERGGKPICEIVPAKPPRFSSAHPAKLLRSLPKPDEDHLTVVRETVTNQPPMAKSGRIDSSVLIAAGPAPINLPS